MSIEQEDLDKLKEEELIKLKQKNILPGFNPTTTYFSANEKIEVSLDIERVKAIAQYNQELVDGAKLIG